MNTNSLSKDKILLHTTCIEIYTKFLDLKEFPKTNISSPFTKDENPSFKVWKNGTFKCNSSGKQGDVFQFVAELYNLDCKKQFNDVLQVIASKMNISLHDEYNTTGAKSKSTKNTIKTGEINDKLDLQATCNDNNKRIAIEELQYNVDVQICEMQENHLAFWNNLGVKKNTLDFYNVYAISNYSFFSSEKNKQFSFNIKNEIIAFCYEVKGNFEVYIPSQPNYNQKKAFNNGLQAGDIFGLEQLGNDKVENLIICAGKKDTIIANSRGFKAVTFRSETHHPTTEQIEKLQSHCNNLLICYDNDKGGETGRNTIIKKYNTILPILLPKNEYIKGYDITDYFQDHSAEDFQKLIDVAVKNKNVIEPKNDNKYQLPDEIKEPLENFINDIEHYQMFMANNQIWIMKREDKKYTFYSVSNFAISILQHLQDEKYPIKLIRLKNTQNVERVFDIPADAINTLSKLDNVLSNQGNYRFYGKLSDFNLLKRYLLEKMGTGKKIEVLGWQEKANFWVWNNRINLCNGKYLELNKFGCFEYENKSYYVPSANKFNENNDYHYEPQKKFLFVKSTNNVKTFISKVIEVQGENGISAILFTISSLFSDIVFKKTGGFPILFLYGAFGSGKTQLAKCCQSFFGIPQDALNLENGTSTKVAHIRELSQFKNSISHLAEYKTGNREVDGTLKGIYDRNGYKRGVRDSNRGTDSVPIESTAILTGNYYPNDEALISRVIWLEIQENEYTEIEKKNYFELSALIDNGVSSFSDDFLSKRKLFEDKFYELYKNYTLVLPEKIKTNISRLAQNLAILLATFKVFESDNIFPFSEDEIIKHFSKSTEYQMSKLKSANMLIKWWDCFLICFKLNTENGFEANKDFRLEGNIISFTISNVFAKIQRQWYSQYKENIPSQSTISEALKKDKCFIEQKSTRIRTGGDPVLAYRINISEINISDEFLEHYNYINNIDITTTINYKY